MVLNPSTLDQIDQLRSWLKQPGNFSSAKNIKTGYRVLFYGPAGTGKSLSAALLAKELGLELYKVDLSHIISKYIGETEKNLAKLFDEAERSNWVLFFDEADALFGKRTDVKDSHDKYANQEVSYLLQRIEDYQGLLILAPNMKSNLDHPFIRRFQSVIHFPLPTPAERKRIWEAGLLENKLDQEKIDLDSIAQMHELSPASIMNVVHYVHKKSESGTALTEALVIKGIHEYSPKVKS